MSPERTTPRVLLIIRAWAPGPVRIEVIQNWPDVEPGVRVLARSRSLCGDFCTDLLTQESTFGPQVASRPRISARNKTASAPASIVPCHIPVYHLVFLQLCRLLGAADPTPCLCTLCQIKKEGSDLSEMAVITLSLGMECLDRLMKRS